MKIAFFGDLALTDKINIYNLLSFSDLYDIGVVNVETSVSLGNKKTRKVVNIHSDIDEMKRILHSLKIGCANLANNHVMDYGIEGLIGLIEAMTDHGVKCFGAGKNKREAEQPVIIECDGIKIELIGFSWAPIETVAANILRGGAAKIPSLPKLCEVIKEKREESDYLVVCFHWGYEYEVFPLPWQRKIAHAAINSGADLIIGHHPHVIQGREIYKGKYIYYSIGDLFLPIIRRKGIYEGMIPILSFDKYGVKNYRLFFSKYDPVRGELIIYNSDCMKERLSILSEPLKLDFYEYIKFFREHRLRRRGLPVFTGNSIDNLRYVWLKLRSYIVRNATLYGLHSRF